MDTLDYAVDPGMPDDRAAARRHDDCRIPTWSAAVSSRTPSRRSRRHPGPLSTRGVEGSMDEEEQRTAACLPRRRRKTCRAAASRCDGAIRFTTPQSASLRLLDARDGGATLNPFAFMFYRPFPNRALAPWDLFEFGFKNGPRELLTIVLMSLVGRYSRAPGARMSPASCSTRSSPTPQRTELITVAALLIVAALVTTLFNLGEKLRASSACRESCRCRCRVRCGIGFLSLPLPFFRQYAAGDLAQRSTAFSLIHDVLSGSVLSAHSVRNLLGVLASRCCSTTARDSALDCHADDARGARRHLQRGLCSSGCSERSRLTMGHIAGIVVEFISGIAKFRIAGAERRAFVLWVKEFAEQKRLGFESEHGQAPWLPFSTPSTCRPVSACFSS